MIIPAEFSTSVALASYMFWSRWATSVFVSDTVPSILIIVQYIMAFVITSKQINKPKSVVKLHFAGKSGGCTL
jgi:hypothetical protein